MTETPVVNHEVPGGGAWSVRVRAGRELRLTALGDGANCSTLIFADRHPVDRLNIPDTLKAQMSARVHPPMVLMSDLGAALCSVTGSSLDWHDCLCGHSVDAQVARFGPSSYSSDRNGWRHSARSGLLSELRKHGRGAADLHGCVNFFAKVATSTDQVGSLTFVPEYAKTGDWVTLRAELDVLVVLSTAPHPLDTRWAPQGVRAEVGPAEAPGPDDSSWTFRPESARALQAAREVLA
ncbi:urea amidolyase associated protein UAAP1 [Amycolatopsis sp. H20-H5]|uniref:urea amidolyase associated protein UAAP1 n=1 Tax=Amycolatopsis sp. H20-H5 TaxID=3046309 RepID=UPI002DBAFA2E|nr:urea amidolyase associated protein UAAP1 [Amycolatopsis sp. H20-H5]MEC3979455.1 urea amidolyase associated protein UAAP1 [Amycolatopsis sp. H20-H5]